MKKLIVLSGAGISQESGLQTFRDEGGLWDEYDIMEVATPEAWESNPERVLEFYNLRRKFAFDAQPNDAHLSIAKLEKHFDVQIITQNVDDLHERAGSTKVLHLHGELTKARSTVTQEIIDIQSNPITFGDHCSSGFQLRPHIVWFGEPVTEILTAQELLKTADILIVVGTSLNVYPAAGLTSFAPKKCKKFLVDPGEFSVKHSYQFEHIKEKATIGIPKVANELIKL